MGAMNTSPITRATSYSSLSSSGNSRKDSVCRSRMYMICISLPSVGRMGMPLSYIV